uniref:Uncharacterized protein n=1 Tax=viral metagenome TaxID=1070528 RepID=A0A6C0C6N2_9ZZZZ
METGQVTIMMPEVKTFRVRRVVVQDLSYTGDDVDRLALWYYLNINPDAENLIIFIHGDWHQTYPQPFHITVEYDNDGQRSRRYHMIKYPDGNFHPQDQPPGLGQKKNKYKKSKKLKKKKNKSKKLKKKSKK